METREQETERYLQCWGHLPFWADTNANFKRRWEAEERRIKEKLLSKKVITQV